jgi:hypothetical protein
MLHYCEVIQEKNNTNDKTDTTELTDIISTMGNKLHFKQYQDGQYYCSRKLEYL